MYLELLIASGILGALGGISIFRLDMLMLDIIGWLPVYILIVLWKMFWSPKGQEETKS